MFITTILQVVLNEFLEAAENNAPQNEVKEEPGKRKFDETIDLDTPEHAGPKGKAGRGMKAKNSKRGLLAANDVKVETIASAADLDEKVVPPIKLDFKQAGWRVKRDEAEDSDEDAVDDPVPGGSKQPAKASKRLLSLDPGLDDAEFGDDDTEIPKKKAKSSSSGSSGKRKKKSERVQIALEESHLHGPFNFSDHRKGGTASGSSSGASSKASSRSGSVQFDGMRDDLKALFRNH